jgi:hypothetical protein
MANLASVPVPPGTFVPVAAANEVVTKLFSVNSQGKMGNLLDRTHASYIRKS